MKKILVVDDDQFIRELYEDVLTQAGYEVVAAQDGEEGLAQILNGGFDLILLDIMLPKLDGIGVLSKLAAKTPKTKNGPVLVLTNLTADPMVAETVKLGARGYLLKAEFTPDKLLAAVKEYLG